MMPRAISHWSNTAMADAGLAAWDGKWFYQFWRPVTAIRNAEADGNSAHAPQSDLVSAGCAGDQYARARISPRPSRPTRPGIATFGGALFGMMRHYWPDRTPFTFTSDEFNGKNRDIYGNIMPLHPLSYRSFSDAEYDNAESRIWIGVHWQFDADAGVKVGNDGGGLCVRQCVPEGVIGQRKGSSSFLEKKDQKTFVFGAGPAVHTSRF